MKDKQKNIIKELQSVLQSIEDGNPKFFNVSNFEKLGLITSKKKYGFDSVGNKIELGYDFFLTKKAKRYLNIEL